LYGKVKVTEDECVQIVLADIFMESWSIYVKPKTKCFLAYSAHIYHFVAR